MACAGNLNLDGITRTNRRGIEDLVVGAPYDDDGAGAIYIYMGSVDGVMKQYAQKISSLQMGSGIRTFGWSLSAGMDVDRNRYPDLLIGAYESGNAVYLKSAPVVQMQSKVSVRVACPVNARLIISFIPQVNFRVSSKQIDIERKGCTLRDGRTRVPCVDVEVRMLYDGEGVPDRIGTCA